MPTFPGFDRTNPFYQGFESTPEGQRASYFSYQKQFGKSPSQKEFFQKAFQQVQDRYRGMGAAYLKQGGQSPESWDANLDDYFAPQGGAEQQWRGMSPKARGHNESRFAPATRWNF